MPLRCESAYFWPRYIGYFGFFFDIFSIGGILMKSNPRRALWKFLCLILALVLTVLLAVSIYAQHLLGQIQYVSQADAPASEKAPSAALESLLDSRSHILLIGQDRLPGEERARSDCMILCDFDPETKTITMTSFLRDLYVPIPGHGSNRLNAAYALGGMPLLEETLIENFDIPIDGCVEVDFQGFPQIIDLLGGVRISLRADEAEAINGSLGCALTEGDHILDGDQALAYVRLRKLDTDGDFSRTQRQRTLLTSLLESYREISPVSALLLLEEALPLLTTDLTGPELLKTGLSLVPMLGSAQVVTRHVPADGTYESKSIDGMSVLVPDLEANRAILSGT